MTIDERLQALTESVELLASLHRDLERETSEKIRSLAVIAEQNEVRAGQMDKRAAQMDEHAAQMDKRAAQMMEAITRLARVVENHERRIDGLEH
jgi:hypothetical protein